MLGRKVSYSNTNTYIKEAAEEAEQLADFADATEELSQGQQIEWRASSYMEVDEAMGGGMQKTIQPDLELLETCRPIIERCDEIFKQWYVHECVHVWVAAHDVWSHTPQGVRPSVIVVSESAQTRCQSMCLSLQ